MADPLSTAASIAGLLSLARRILAEGYTYIASIQNSPSALGKLLSEISRLEAILGQVNEIIQESASSVVQPQSSKQRIAEVMTPDAIKTASDLLQSLTGLCGRIAGQNRKKIGQAIAWPLKEREVKESLDRFKRLINTFEVALSSESSVNERTTAILDEQQEERVHKLLEILSPLDPPKRHQDLQARRYKGSVLRLLEYEHFRVWQDSSIGIENTSNRILQCYGIPGAGKTIVSSMVIDHLLSHYGEQRVAYIYCDYRDKANQNLLNIMGSILKQHLAAATHIQKAILDLLESFQEQGRKVPIKDMARMLKSAISQTGSYFLCIDAVDELAPGARLELLKALQTEFGNSRIFLTGRPHITSDVSRILQIYPANAIQITPNPIEVRAYLTYEIDLDWEMNPGDMNEQLKGEILHGIVTRAQGMFLLPALHISMILEQPTMAKRRKAISTLPLELNDAYTRMVGRIQNSSSLSYLGMRVLVWLHLAKRPLRVNEIQHVLAVEYGDIVLEEEAIPAKKRLLDCCLGLVLVDEETSTIRLVHHTLEEYFRKHSSTIFPHGHYTVAEMCLTYLNLSGLNVKCETHIDMMQLLERFPFLEYAACNWGHHTALAQGSSGMDVGGLAVLAMKVLLRKSGQLPHIALQILYWGIHGSLPWDSFWYDYHGHSLKVLGVHAAAYFGLETYMSELANDQGWSEEGANGRSPLSFAASGGQEAVVRLLVEQTDVKVDSVDVDCRTPLSWAAEGGYEAVVRLLVERENVNADSKDVDDRTPLSWAARGGHEAIVRLLVERKDVNTDSQDEDGRTPLSWAAEGGYGAVVGLLLGREDVDAGSQDEDGRTPLSWAAEGGHEAVMRMLVWGDVDADSQDKDGRTPLSWAAGEGQMCAVQLLVEREDVDADLTDQDGRAPLSWAAEGGNAAVVRLLVERGDVDADSQDVDGRTPLSWAAEEGHEAVVHLLVEREDVDAGSKDKSGRTPLSWAARGGHEAVVRLLVERGDVDADSKDKSGRTTLSWAAEAGHEAIVRLLVEREDVDVNSKDKDGRIPLSWASEGGHEAVLRVLFEREDVNTDYKDKSGQTPLSWAAGEGQVGAVRLLVVRQDVDAGSTDKVGRTPLSWAAEGRHEAVVQLLVERQDVDADSADKDGRTPLSWAAEGGSEAVVQLLVGREDVDVNSKDKDGRTPLFWSVEGVNDTVWLFFERADVDVDSKDNGGRTLLSWTAERHYITLVHALVERQDVDVDSTDNGGRTPLSWAAGEGRGDLVRLLVEWGDADADSPDEDGRTPLSWAAEGGHEAVVRLLVAREDVDADSMDRVDRTPLLWAAEGGHEAIVRLLLVRLGLM